MAAAQRRQHVGTVPGLAAIDRLFDQQHTIWGQHHPSELAELVAKLPVPDHAGGTYHAMPQLATSAQAKAYIDARIATWEASRQTR